MRGLLSYVIPRSGRPKNLVDKIFPQKTRNKMLKRVQHDKQFPVTLNCLGFCFTKSRCSLHFVVVRLTFCSFVSALSLRTTQNPLVSGSILKDTSAKASVWRQIFSVILRSERPKNLFCEIKGSPQESSSFLSCWGTRYSFPSCKNIRRMFLLRQSLIEKKRKNNGYEKGKYEQNACIL